MVDHTTAAPTAPAPASAAAEEVPRGNRKWGILGVTFSFQVFCALSLAFLSPIAPFLMAPTGLGITGAEFGLLFTASNLGTTILLIFTGHFVDKIGVRVIMLAGQILMGVSLGVGALVNAPWQLLVVLFVTGLAQSVAGPTGAKAITGWFERRWRGLSMGVKQAGIPAASVIAGALIPVTATAVGWRGTVALVGAVIVVSGVVSFALYREPPLQQDHARAGRSWRDSASSVLKRDITLLSVGSGLLQATQFTFTSFLVAYLTTQFTARGIPSAVIVAGSILSLSALGGVIGRVGLGVVSDRLFAGRRKGTLVVVNLVATLVLVVLAVAGSTLPTGVLAALTFVFGITGISFTGLQISMAAELAGFEAAGAATGFTLAFAFGFMMILPPVFGAIEDGAGYFWFWLLLAVVSAVGVGLLALVREGRALPRAL